MINAPFSSTSIAQSIQALQQTAERSVEEAYSLITSSRVKAIEDIEKKLKLLSQLLVQYILSKMSASKNGKDSLLEELKELLSP